MKIYVINMARAADRMARLGARLADIGLRYERVEALDRLAIAEAELRAAFGTGARSRRLPATPGDMACSLTHQQVWRRIAQDPGPALILEDDAWPADSLADWVAGRAEQAMRGHGLDVLRLEYWPTDPPSRRALLGTPLARLDGARLYRLRGSAFGSCAYVITPAAAGRLLTAFPKMEVPVDHHISGERAAMGWRVLRIGFVNPAPVWHDVVGLGSDMRAERAALAIDKAQHSPRAKAAKWRMAWRKRALLRLGLAEMVWLDFDGAGPAPKDNSSN